jgi:hypothetical protein
VDQLGTETTGAEVTNYTFDANGNQQVSVTGTAWTTYVIRSSSLLARKRLEMLECESIQLNNEACTEATVDIERRLPHAPDPDLCWVPAAHLDWRGCSDSPP